MNTLELILQALAKNAASPADTASPSHKATNPPTALGRSGAAPTTTGSHREVGAPPAVTPAPLPPAALGRAPAAPSPSVLVHPDDGKPLGAACRPGARVDWSKLPQRDRRDEPLRTTDRATVRAAAALATAFGRYHTHRSSSLPRDRTAA